MKVARIFKNLCAIQTFQIGFRSIFYIVLTSATIPFEFLRQYSMSLVMVCYVLVLPLLTLTFYRLFDQKVNMSHK